MQGVSSLQKSVEICSITYLEMAIRNPWNDQFLVHPEMEGTRDSAVRQIITYIPKLTCNRVRDSGSSISITKDNVDAGIRLDVEFRNRYN